jgi:hypothetical protein
VNSREPWISGRKSKGAENIFVEYYKSYVGLPWLFFANHRPVLENRKPPYSSFSSSNYLRILPDHEYSSICSRKRTTSEADLQHGVVFPNKLALRRFALPPTWGFKG